MARVSKIQNSFTSGELSPRLASRTDLKAYNNGCAKLKNFSVIVHGGAYKRPGTKYISTAGVPTDTVRLIPFIYSESQSYVLEFGHKYMRVYTNGGAVLTNSGTEIYQLTTTIDADELANIKHVQSADTMYMANPYVHPQKLTRTDHDDWAIANISFTNGPFLDENETATTVVPSSVTGGATLSGTTNIFNVNHVGSIWRIAGTKTQTKSIGGADSFTDSIEVDSGERVIVNLTGTWSATVTVQVSYDDGTNWLDLAEHTSNVSTAYTENLNDTLYRVGVKAGDYSSGTVQAVIGKLGQYGYIEVSEYLSPTQVSGTIQKDFPTTDATLKWSEGSWSVDNGYPSSISFYEERLVFAGTEASPATIWGSKVDDYENFDAGSKNDSDAYNFTLAADNLDVIHSIVPAGKVLHCFSLGGEWSFGDTVNPTTPTNVSAERQTTKGSTNIQALLVGHVLLFFQKGARKLFQKTYNYVNESYVADEISKLAEHLLRVGISEVAYASQPDPTIWMVRTDGVLISAAYEPENQVIAFSQYETDGLFESICVIPGSDRDELWAVVKRTTASGSTTRYIEQFATTQWENLEDSLYLDSALSYTGEAATTVSGLDHLEGLTVGVTTSGAVHKDVVVSDGKITLEYPATQINAGLKYSAVLQTMNIQGETQAGTSQTKKTSISKVAVNVLNTIGLNVGDTEGNLDLITFGPGSQLMGTAPSLFTGTKEKVFPKGWDKDLSIVLTSDQPLPCHILSIVSTVSASGH